MKLRENSMDKLRRRWVSTSSIPFIAALLCLGACDDEAPATEEETTHGLTRKQASEVLAVVGEKEITLGEFAQTLADQSPHLRARFDSPERRKEFLDNMIRNELLTQEAIRRGYLDRPEVKRAKKQAMVQQFMKQRVEEGVKLSDVTDDEILAYYESHKEDFIQPRQLRASHILFKNKKKAERILGALQQRPNDMAFFREQARLYNEDAFSKRSYGDLRLFSHPDEVGSWTFENVPKPVARAAFELTKNGELFPKVVETEQGFHIIKRIADRPALNRTMEETRRTIQNAVWQQKREAAIQKLISDLKSAATVELHPEALQMVKVKDTKQPEGH